MDFTYVSLELLIYLERLEARPYFRRSNPFLAGNDAARIHGRLGRFRVQAGEVEFYLERAELDLDSLCVKHADEDGSNERRRETHGRRVVSS